jgi:7-carboxy-7-deazaguanine synthase
MIITEIFYSIQGEGRWMGLPNIFIRTTGCNLRCTYCDTKYSYENGEKITLSNIIENIKHYHCSHVCVTGGEPLIQEDTPKLIDLLIKKGYTVCLETNGSLSIKRFVGNPKLMISLDIKCPSSRMHEIMVLDNMEFLSQSDQLKFVIGTKHDYLYAKTLIHKNQIHCPIFFQPVWGFDPKILVSWMLKDHLSVQLGIQLHKILLGEEK